MSATPDSKRIRWDASAFHGKTVPEEAKRYLVEIGLPAEISGSTFEFGIFDSDGSELVIGVDYEAPIILRASGVVEIEREDGAWFFNSDVDRLDRCILAYEKMRRVANDQNAASVLADARELIKRIDPRCDVPRLSVWRTVLDDFESMAT